MILIIAVLPEGTVVKQIPRLLSDKVKIVSDSIIFASERSVPSGYELIESGILLTDIGADANEESFNLENIDVIKAVSQSSRTNGQFTVRRDRALGTWYARAYLIYRDIAQNKYKVIYGNIISGTV